MTPELLVAVIAVFAAVALGAGAIGTYVAGMAAPERRRLRKLDMATSSGILVDGGGLLTDNVSPTLRKLSRMVPKSPKDMSLLRRRLTAAGYGSMSSVIAFSTARLVLPVAIALTALTAFGLRRGLLIAALGGMVGLMLPDFWLSRKTKERQKLIRNGLPDALDLLIVCLEAGSSIDQAIMKASEELQIAHPVLASELRLVTTETRAGKARLEALKNFAARTRVEDVRSLVTMLVQTERFGTSLSQALRTHADVSRTKRRQRAEERAQKVGVKMVFPLVFFLFPALYIVILGPAVVKFANFFGSHGAGKLP
jgi:tight adherence protein C